MRLLNIWTLEFEEFFDQNVPPYYILSHRWGKDEVSFKEFRKGHRKDSAGYRKVFNFCDFVKNRNAGAEELASDERLTATWKPETDFDWVPRSNVEWVWIDTICIDKRSSAELTEAINSMFAWYRKSEACITYLEDVGIGERDVALGEGWLFDSFKQSKWFTRGWTLQELLAPSMVVFCDAQWRVCGHKCASRAPCITCLISRNVSAYGPCLLETWLPHITQIEPAFLVGGPFIGAYQASVAQRMSWASGRTTTRREDEAYCLLGLFGIHMPLLYGEGNRAFRRLQEQIIRESTDQSILAWGAPGDGWGYRYPTALLARSVKDFKTSGNVCVGRYLTGPKRVTILNEGIEMQAVLTTASVKDITKRASPELAEFLNMRINPAIKRLYFLKLACHRVDDSVDSKALPKLKDVELVLTEDDTLQRQFVRWFDAGIGEYTTGFQKEVLGSKPILIVPDSATH